MSVEKSQQISEVGVHPGSCLDRASKTRPTPRLHGRSRRPPVVASTRCRMSDPFRRCDRNASLRNQLVRRTRGLGWASSRRLASVRPIVVKISLSSMAFRPSLSVKPRFSSFTCYSHALALNGRRTIISGVTSLHLIRNRAADGFPEESTYRRGSEMPEETNFTAGQPRRQMSRCILSRGCKDMHYSQRPLFATQHYAINRFFKRLSAQ